MIESFNRHCNKCNQHDSWVNNTISSQHDSDTKHLNKYKLARLSDKYNMTLRCPQTYKEKNFTG